MILTLSLRTVSTTPPILGITHCEKPQLQMSPSFYYFIAGECDVAWSVTQLSVDISPIASLMSHTWAESIQHGAQNADESW